MKGKLQIVIRAVQAVLLMQLSVAVYAQYSSIAGSPNEPIFGYAVGYASIYQADARALKECNRISPAGQCNIVHQSRGPGCVALAQASNGSMAWGAAFGEYSQDNRSVARSIALVDCLKWGQHCPIARSQCTN